MSDFDARLRQYHYICMYIPLLANNVCFVVLLKSGREEKKLLNKVDLFVSLHTKSIVVAS